MAEHALPGTHARRASVRAPSRRSLQRAAIRIGWACVVLIFLTLIGFGTGALQMFVVISGSMEPAIETGSLVLARPVRASGVEVGDIVSVPRQGDLPVIHRVVEATPQPDGQVILRLKGDANAVMDSSPYTVDEVLTPVWIAAGLGGAVQTVQRAPQVLIAHPIWPVSIGIAFIAIAGVTRVVCRPPQALRAKGQRSAN